MGQEIQLPQCWKSRLESEFNSSYMKELRSFLMKRLQAGVTIFPHGQEIFQALKLTPFDQVKVVIIGQDPYHGIGQAHGLCFSVRPGVMIPPSLKNIYQELQNDLGFLPPKHGHLTSWAREGVLLLNQVLTVEKSSPASHQGKGWEKLTDRVVELLNTEREGLVFLLWGSPAQKKARHVDGNRHLILKSPHPSPLSAHRGFFGQNHFSKANDYFISRGIDPINWQLPQESREDFSQQSEQVLSS